MPIWMKRPLGAIPAEKREFDAGFGPVGNFHLRGGAAHLGFHPARVRGVHLDRGIAQLVCPVNGEGIQAGFIQ